jgi:hypothetical protein
MHQLSILLRPGTATAYVSEPFAEKFVESGVSILSNFSRLLYVALLGAESDIL